MSETMVDLVAKCTISFMNGNECPIFEEKEECIRDDNSHSIPFLQSVEFGQLRLSPACLLIDPFASAESSSM
jgi:hypothetical protein